MTRDNIDVNNVGTSKPKNNNYKNKNNMMTKKQVEEAVCWILSDKVNMSFDNKLKYVMNELRGKADSSLIRKVVGNYKW